VSLKYIGKRFSLGFMFTVSTEHGCGTNWRNKWF